MHEGPAKNLLPKRLETAQQDTKTQRSLLVFLLGSKNVCFKLGRFSCIFAEIRDKNELETEFLTDRNVFLEFNLHLVPFFSSSFPFFFRYFKVRIRVHALLGALRALVNSIAWVR